MLLSLAARSDVDVSLLCARQWLEANGRLPGSCPLRDIPLRSFAMPENLTERCWKIAGVPKMDPFLPAKADWVYCPMETRLPVKKCPVAITVHDIKAFEPNLPWSNTPAHRRFRRRVSYWIHKAIQEAEVVFAVSEFTKRRMVELLDVPVSKIVVSGNGVDERYDAIRSRRLAAGGSSAASPYALIIGGLRRQKGAEAVLNVASAMQFKHPEFQFQVVGQNEPEWLPIAKSLKNVTLHGFLADAAVDELLCRATALLFLSEYEGFGIPPLEAMAAGVPAIVADRASMPEVVGNAAYVVDPEDTHGIAELLADLAGGSEHYDATKGAAWASRFTWKAVADRVCNGLNDHGRIS